MAEFWQCILTESCERSPASYWLLMILLPWHSCLHLLVRSLRCPNQPPPNKSPAESVGDPETCSPRYTPAEPLGNPGSWASTISPWENKFRRPFSDSSHLQTHKPLFPLNPKNSQKHTYTSHYGGNRGVFFAFFGGKTPRDQQVYFPLSCALC